MRPRRDILSLIGNTPLVRLRRVVEELEAVLYGKLEFLNPSGSLKDRPALHMVNEAERQGLLRPGDLIVEATSGNMGLSLALVASVKRYRCLCVLPETASEDKLRALVAMGAEVVSTPAGLLPEDERSPYRVAASLAQERGGIYLNQYFNALNPEAHQRSTGPEIWRDTGGALDALVCGVGTGGTISGAGRYLKERNPRLEVIGVEPVGSVYAPYLKEGVVPRALPSRIEGIGKNFIPGVIDFSVIDDVIQVEDDEAWAMAQRLAREEGLLVGGSSGAVVVAALRYAGQKRGRRIVALLADSGLKYLSRLRLPLVAHSATSELSRAVFPPV